jgi:hypothetical protein
MMQILLALLWIFALPTVLLAQAESKIEAQASHKEAGPAKEAARDSVDSAAGVEWHIPNDWEIGAATQMRVATYVVSPAKEDSVKAECAVYYFGPEQGGGVEENIKRWMSQVRAPEDVERSEFESGCCPVTVIEINGTYLESAGPMMAVKAEHPGWTLAGAIVEAPGGNVFFKLTGPQATVEMVWDEFLEMLKSTRAVS